MYVRLVLRGREQECRILDGLLDAVRAGESRALVLHGEAGVGKTALLDYARDRAHECRVVRVVAVQSEMELAFAGLHALCAPLLDVLDRVPEPQRGALLTAFGVSTGRPPDRALVGLAVLSLLAEAAAERPLVCLVDDAQWLDRTSAPALTLAGRRLGSESVALVIALRGLADGPEWAGLPRLAVDGLPIEAARELLASVLPGPLDDRVRDRIVAETHGNPLALLELPRDPDFGAGLGPSDLTGRIEESFLRRYEALPERARRVLLVAAAEPVGDLALLRRAAARLGLDDEAAVPATEAGLVELGAHVRFRHPLVRSAIYGAATAEARQAAHRALADATDPRLHPDRRAWHRAQGSAEPDEAVAAELERSAARARARGGLPAAAAFLQRATELTADPDRRAERALDAAHLKVQAGSHEAALTLLSVADAGPLDARGRARLDLVRGQLAFYSSSSNEAAALILRAARQLEPLDPVVARELYLDALGYGLFVGRRGGTIGLTDVAREALRACQGPVDDRPMHVLLEGFALTITGGYAAGASTLRRAVAASRTADMPDEDAIRWLWLATHAAHDIWDDDGWNALSVRHIEVARRAGALAVLPIALTTNAGLRLLEGDFTAARGVVDEIDATIEATGSDLPRYAAMALAAWEGRERDAAVLIDLCTVQAASRGKGLGESYALHTAAVLANALGRHGDALAAARKAAAHPEELGFAVLVLPELVEAAVRVGDTDAAATALAGLRDAATAAGGDWALGLAGLCSAVAGGPEVMYVEAIERLAGTRVAVDHARAHLLYGEWLRRARRRADARRHLRTAHELLRDMGAGAFADRAWRELQATGETARRRADGPSSTLTPQEAQIARLAASGLSNADIGVRLFISPRTVEYHLYNAFAKLDISSRTQLALSLPGAGASGIGAVPSAPVASTRATGPTERVRDRRQAR